MEGMLPPDHPTPLLQCPAVDYLSSTCTRSVGVADNAAGPVDYGACNGYDDARSPSCSCVQTGLGSIGVHAMYIQLTIYLFFSLIVPATGMFSSDVCRPPPRTTSPLVLDYASLQSHTRESFSETSLTAENIEM